LLLMLLLLLLLVVVVVVVVVLQAAGIEYDDVFIETRDHMLQLIADHTLDFNQVRRPLGHDASCCPSPPPNDASPHTKWSVALKSKRRDHLKRVIS
jgi:hypothetical protein